MTSFIFTPAMQVKTVHNRNKVVVNILLGDFIFLNLCLQIVNDAKIRNLARFMYFYRKKKDVMRHLLFVLMVVACTVCHAANFKVDSLTFSRVLFLDCESCSHPTASYSIPQVKTDNPELTDIANSINSQINDFDFFAADCHGVSFNYEMEDMYLLLDIVYVGYGAHGDVDNYETLLFDLETGNKVCFSEETGVRIPFASLFTLDGYFKFLNSRKWDDGVYKSFFVAYKDYYEYDWKNDRNTGKVADSLMVDSIAFGHAKYAQFHIDYSVNENEFYFYREGICYSDFCYADRCFEPGYSDKCLIKEIKPYLNKIGKVVVDNKKSRIQKIVEAARLKEMIDNRMFFEISDWECENTNNSTGEEEDEICKYIPHKVAIDYSDPEKIEGYLFVGDKKEKIIVSQQGDDTILKSKRSDWSFRFSKNDIDDCFWNKEKRTNGLIIGCNLSNDPY
ncbi:MAG: hypothetical protein MJZ23_06820 [Paludibacteraceae bacterium]|nr:hypothetical protein [Paludibacteraceae bacterium]